MQINVAFSEAKRNLGENRHCLNFTRAFFLVPVQFHSSCTLCYNEKQIGVMVFLDSFICVFVYLFALQTLMIASEVNAAEMHLRTKYLRNATINKQIFVTDLPCFISVVRSFFCVRRCMNFSLALHNRNDFVCMDLMPAALPCFVVFFVFFTVYSYSCTHIHTTVERVLMFVCGVLSICVQNY